MRYTRKPIAVIHWGDTQDNVYDDDQMDSLIDFLKRRNIVYIVCMLSTNAKLPYNGRKRLSGRVS